MKTFMRFAAGSLALAMLLAMPLSALAAEVSVPLSDTSPITITNNFEPASDTVTVGGLIHGDVVKLYADEGLTLALGAAMAEAEGTALVIVDQLVPGDAAGIVYITVISTGMQESPAYAVHVPAADASPPLSVANAISVTSNAYPSADIIVIGRLNPGDVITLYTDRLLTERLGDAAADGTGTAVLTVEQLVEDDMAGMVYLTVTTASMSESGAFGVPVPAAGITASLSAQNAITVTNNTGSNDTIEISGLLAGDVINVYADDMLTALLGTATANTAGFAMVSVPQLYPDDAAGIVYVTVTNVGKLESIAVPVAVPTAGTSAPLSDANTITVTNNAVGTSDTIVIEGLVQGDKIQVYGDRELTALMGTATAGVTGIAVVTFSQILPGDAGGEVYITVTRPGKPESPYYTVMVPPSNASAPLTEANVITVANRVGSGDTIVIEGLVQGDKIKVYSDVTLFKLLGAAVAGANGTATVNVPQLIAGDAAGEVYITVTNPGKLESAAYTVAVPGADTSAPLTTDNPITVTNRAGASDTIVIGGVTAGDKLRVYSDDKLTNLIGTATATAAGTAMITVPQLIANDEGGDVYITVTSPGLKESAAYAVTVPPVGQTEPLTEASPIGVKNNAAGLNDTIVIEGLVSGSRIRVYSDENLTNLLGTAVASAAGKATVTVAQLVPGDLSGTVYITVTSSGLRESDPVAVPVPAPYSTAPLSEFNTITVTNNAAGTSDTIVISRLAQGDKIRVYGDPGLTILLGTATAAAAGTVTVKIPQIFENDASGIVYITVTNYAATESTAIPVIVPEVMVSPALSGFNTITVTNNTAGISDTVVVTFLSKNDRIRVYADSGLTVLLGTATANASGVATVKISQIIPKDAAGTIYITVTGTAELESNPIAVAVPAADASPPLSNYNMFYVTNNAAGTYDTITVTRLAQRDTIRVYADEACAILLGSGKAAAAGPAVIKVPQLTVNDAAGVVYLTVTNAGRMESTPYAVSVPAANVSIPLTAGNIISVANSAAGTKDTIVVGGLSQNDKIKVYSDGELKNLLGTATAAANGRATFTTAQLTRNDEAGVVYITVTAPSAQESTALAVNVPAASMTAPLSGFSSITVTNNAAGTNDTIVVDMLAQGDKIKVYSDVNLANLLGSATANTTGRATVTVKQLTPGDAAGTVYVTVTNAAARESVPLPVAVPPVRTTAPLSGFSTITVTNNAPGINDTVVIDGLAKGDRIRVYADSRLTALLGTATANASGVATVTVKQLSQGTGDDTVYITVTNPGATESTAIPVDVPGVNTSAPLSADYPVTVANKAAGTNDTVVVEGLIRGDRIRVYADDRLTALLGTATANASGIATVKVVQLTAGDAAGIVYLTVTNHGRLESPAVPVDVPEAGVSAPLSEVNTVTVTNNATGKSDTIVITGLIKGDKVRVYSDYKLINQLGTATANASGVATVTVAQLIAKDAAGTVYVTITTPGMAPSEYRGVAVPAASVSPALTEANIVSVKNNASGKNDTIMLTGLVKGDKIKIYSDNKKVNVIGTATVGVSGSVTVSVKQLIAGDAAGTVYITVTGTGLLESPVYALAVPAAEVSIPIGGSST